MNTDKRLVERLRDDADRRYGSCDSLRSLEWEAADHIETQAAEIERLRATLAKVDQLIKHQYSGSRQAMSDLTEVAQEVAEVLGTLGEQP